MDSSGSGSLTTEELSRFLCSDGLCLSADRLRDALQDAHGAAAASADEGDGLSLQVLPTLDSQDSPHVVRQCTNIEDSDSNLVLRRFPISAPVYIRYSARSFISNGNNPISNRCLVNLTHVGLWLPMRPKQQPHD
jgi:hypothetical protein